MQFFFSIEIIGSFHLFFWNVLPNTQVWITIVCISVVLPSKHGAPWKNWLVQLATQTTVQCFFSGRRLHFCTSTCSHSVLCVLPILSTRILKIWVFKGQDLTEINNFYCFNRILSKISSETEFSFYWECMEVRKTLETSTLESHCLSCAKAPGVLITIPLQNEWGEWYRKKKSKSFLIIIMRKIWTFQILWKHLTRPQGYGGHTLRTAELDENSAEETDTFYLVQSQP